MNITKKEWNAYRKVQVDGQFNMLMPQAQQATGLDKETYSYIIKHYGVLAVQFAKSKKSSS